MPRKASTSLLVLEERTGQPQFTAAFFGRVVCADSY